MKDTLFEFCHKIVVELDNPQIEAINPADRIKELPWWSSMSALIIMAFINTEYGIKFSSEALRNVETLEDIYNLLKKD
jgi:acyl carrier protein